MDIVSNENNLTPLAGRIAEYAASDESRGGEILVASGWIQSEYFKRLFTPQVVEDMAARGISLRVLLRIGSPTDLKISDIELFRCIERMKAKGLAASLRFSGHHHAKVYVVGKGYAMLGSFNLTSGGFGDEAQAGRNPEAGIATEKAGEVKAAAERFEAMWEAARELPPGLVGFVANESEDSGFWVIGVRELPAGMFVQTLAGGKIVLGIVERSLRYRPDFFGADREAILGNPFIFQQFGIPKPKAGTAALNPAALNGIASAGNLEAQLEIARVKPIRVIEEKRDDAAQDRLAFEAPSLPPPVGGEVNEANRELFASLFDPASRVAEAKPYAFLRMNRDTPASFDPERFLSMHSAVLGATGSGKSFFIKRWISSFLIPYNAKWKGRIVVVDTHGEYADAFEAQGLQFSRITFGNGDEAGLETPLVESVEDLEAAFDFKPDRQLKKRLREALASPDALGQEKFIEILRQTNDSAARKEAEAFADALLAKSGDDVPEPYKKDIAKTQERIETARSAFSSGRKTAAIANVKKDLVDKILKEFGYGSAETAVEKVIAAIERDGIRFRRIDFLSQLKKPGLYLMDLRPVNDREARQAVVGELLSQVFIEAKRSGRFPALFIVDEAQNYAPQAEGKSVPSKRAMRTIASEGRKFGVGLMIATQRPAYVDKDVLAQCNSQAIFRLINPGDIAQVEECVEGVSEADLAQLPNFAAGEAIFTGVAMGMPVRVRVTAP